MKERKKKTRYSYYLDTERDRHFVFLSCYVDHAFKRVHVRALEIYKYIFFFLLHNPENVEKINWGIEDGCAPVLDQTPHSLFVFFSPFLTPQSSSQTVLPATKWFTVTTSLKYIKHWKGKMYPRKKKNVEPWRSKWSLYYTIDANIRKDRKWGEFRELFF